MPICIEKIPVEQVNVHDRTFCLSYPVHDEALLESVRKVGIIEPVILLDSTPHILVTGFKRMEAAIELSLPDVPYLLMKGSEKEALLCAIHDNLKRGFNTVEKAYVVDKMLHFGFSMDEVFGIMPLLALPAHEKIMKMLLAVAYAEESLRGFIITRQVSMRNIEQFLRFDPAERAAIIEFLSSMRTTESQLREILGLLGLLKVREGRLDLGPVEHATNPDDIRKTLKLKTNPVLSDLEGRLSAIRQACALPPGIDIRVDPFFEKEYIDISVKARSVKEIEDSMEKIRRITDRGFMESIFELTRG
jgi:hypothetical protein